VGESIGRELGMEKRNILANMTLTIVMKMVPICTTGIVMAPKELGVQFGCSATTKDDYT